MWLLLFLSAVLPCSCVIIRKYPTETCNTAETIGSLITLDDGNVYPETCNLISQPFTEATFIKTTGVALDSCTQTHVDVTLFDALLTPRDFSSSAEPCTKDDTTPSRVSTRLGVGECVSIDGSLNEFWKIDSSDCDIAGQLIMLRLFQGDCTNSDERENSMELALRSDVCLKNTTPPLSSLVPRLSDYSIK